VKCAGFSGAAAQSDGSAGREGIRFRNFSGRRIFRVGAAVDDLLDEANSAVEPESAQVLLPGGAAALLLPPLQRLQLHLRVPRQRHPPKVPVQRILHARLENLNHQFF
jgi:hypothetical protein